MANQKKLSGNRKRNGKKRYNQGFYKIFNVDKYMGDPTKCIYRSSWEFKFMLYLDRTDKILRWGSENIVIPYQDEKGKIHRYYPDFYYEMSINGDPHNFTRVVAEIKPRKETIYPSTPKKKTIKAFETYEYQLKTYQKNLYKWTKAITWCERNKMRFVIIHEDHLKANNIM
jgi:hypothetical protein